MHTPSHTNICNFFNFQLTFSQLILHMKCWNLAGLLSEGVLSSAGIHFLILTYLNFRPPFWRRVYSLIQALNFNCKIILCGSDLRWFLWQYYIAYPYCAEYHPQLVRVHIFKMVAFSKRPGLWGMNHHFFLGNNYQDLTNFLFSLNAAITIFLCSELCDDRPISIVQ